MRSLYKEEMIPVQAYQVDHQLFLTIEECEEYLKAKYLKSFLESIFRDITHFEMDEQYILSKLVEKLMMNGEELKKWL